ncbi:MAG: response regulator [SAR324 cluster bacterium]|nr:response regulator [SAR324 cluster bacterium]
MNENLNILVVDDSPTMRRVVVKALFDEGLKNVTEADDGTTAWQKMEIPRDERDKFQLIILDWNMPKMNGIDFLKKLREDEQYKSIKVLMLTAEAKKDNVLAAIKSGVNGYIVKPFDAKTLIDKLKQMFPA